ncbi:hypothetical protein BFP97_01460 [Roseivirga sp. 4D4]|uniref:hypothetical protein n=1 Tax=Roseivirga sp. 4D4 TaxID=1889784 RepID=UPI0008532908|nr:hypothetical protein [Roseivirga sp. 4D4]OEK00258.1 hypothetical protein BFP97_01460 [Roseivirga sp. 4D4]
MFKNSRISILSVMIILSLAMACNPSSDQGLDFEKEKAAILETINGETRAAFNRDYEAWKSKWIHESSLTKTYIDFSDSTFTETLGWKEIDDFVRTYIEEHPEPDPLPEMVDDIEVRLYGTGAWVSFEQHDANRGLKRETRLMEKVDGEWKIAGMHTTIYGFTKVDQ